VLESFSAKSQQGTNGMERYERKTNWANQQLNPRSRSNSFPHKDGGLTGGIVNIDLVSLFRQVYERIMDGLRFIKLKVNNEWENLPKRVWNHWGKSPLNRFFPKLNRYV
jgi:hypothetical protein